MQIRKNERHGNVVTMEVTDDYVEIEKEFPKAYQQVSKNVKINGFRPGKIPQHVFIGRFGNEVIVEQAANNLINLLYPKIIDEYKLEVVSRPSDVEVLSQTPGEPFAFRFSVEVKPIIKLGKYKGLKVIREKDEVKLDEVEQAIAHIREQYSRYELSLEGAVATSDIVAHERKVLVNEEVIAAWTVSAASAKVGANAVHPDYDDALIGMKVNEEKVFSISMPSDSSIADLAGKVVTFEVKINAIRKVTIPELTDEWVVANTNGNHKTVAEFRDHIEKELKTRKEEAIKKKIEMDLMKLVCEDVTVDIPKVMIEHDIDLIVERIKSNLAGNQMSLEDYFRYTQKSLQSFRDEYQVEAAETVKSRLCLEAIFKAEKMAVTDEEQLTKLKTKNALKPDETLDDFCLRGGTTFLELIKQDIMIEKALDLIVKEAKIKDK